MKVTELLRKDIMLMDLQSTTKNEVIDEMIASLEKHHVINNADQFKEAILKREEQATTGLGNGIAMPHAKTVAVNEATVLFAKSNKGVDYESLDGEPTYLFFMIAVPDGLYDTHLQALAALSRSLLDEKFIEGLKSAKTPDEVVNIFRKREEESEEKEVNVQADTSEKPFIVAVTACPTGIAHTYMAEEALKKKAAEMNVDIRVETNGSEGVKNRLTDDEIRRAKGVIVAADKKVEMSRFNGKPLLERPVSEGINKPEELISKVIKGDAPTFHAENDDRQKEEPSNTSVWGKIYKDLMNGVSHMLPFVVGGGILMAISFLFESTLGDDSVTFKFLNTIGGNAFNFLIPILAGYIAMSIGDRPGLMPGMVGGLMAVNSNAGFLGGLAAGFLAGYIVVFLKKLFRGMPRSLEGLKPILLYPILSLFIVGTLMYFIIGPIFSSINTAVVDFLSDMGTANAVLLGALLGGMMSIDMGGPFNKAAYTFSIGVFTDTGDGSFMAAVMAGGMIPPLAIALATTFFKNKFTDEERRSGLSNYLLGISFITEGAIPFAASDPLRIIGSSIVGSAIAGGLTQLWNTAIPAPHGGIFVIALAERPFMFLIALLIGTVITGLLIGFWRKPVKQ
ncbi:MULTISPECIES: PTS fructose transporter subunit IIABC [Bacillaceae]|uniref:PTS system fructose-specific EIIABC component n=1 Tax=Caldibacillus thermoamylovorans TaxID=35841 RepID=A0A090ISS2_9BACI|nr:MULTISPECIES: fructose-specific PTS transporter subunit EIIC [Bacillaceae]KIO61557.1 PTS system, fructose-specific IIA component [Caldibacillus thermoamylovorans]KIO66897.1 PTS system, fructose-specific IIA component [Caldibacillus thermoamylovorans]KIO71422.1 PTS system, fructose-specific IIA component [Caldibacillus thermoamylovorans]MCM3476142.1 fructose-specific PTS transporter subunit EIIC [Caldibacillus thermoamylovorans]CEE01136.1 PTS system fructose-specific EIIABC component [Caldib